MARISKGKLRWLREQFGPVTPQRTRHESNVRLASYLCSQNPRLTMEQALRNIRAHDRKMHYGRIVINGYGSVLS